MKKALKMFGAVFALGMLFFGCNNESPKSGPSGQPSEEEKKDYSISLETDLLLTQAGTANAKNVDVEAIGTVIVESSNNDVATAVYDEAAKKIKVTGVKVGTADITARIEEDASKTVTFPVTVKPETEEKLKATFNFEEGISPAYFEYIIQDSDAESNKYRWYLPVKKYITDTAGTADDLISNLYVNDEGYVNVKFIAAYDVNGNKIENLVLKSGDSEWFNFDEKKSAGVTFTYGYPSEEKADLTLTFKGFTVPGGSVKINYGADTGTYVDADCTVSEDGSNATVSLEKKYANADGWFNKVTVTVNDKDGKALETSYTNYFEYKAEGISLDVSAKDTSQWKEILPESSFTFTSSGQELVTASSLADLSITKIKFEVYEYTPSDSASWWVSILSSADDWTNEIKLSWDNSLTKGYSAIVDDTNVLEKYKTNGIFIAGGNGHSAKVKVTYQ